MNRRDIELLSSYLDGQLKLSDAERARLELRLASEADLRAVLDDLRAARGLLRQLPMRKAPRNFTLTPQMVGKNPPLPRAYPAFKFVTALASFLLFFTMGLNFLAPQMASQSPAFGMGGGGAPEIYSAQAPAPAATEEAAATEAPALEAPAEEMPPELAPPPTATAPSIEDNAREAVTPLAKDGVAGEGNAQDEFQVQNAPSTPSEAPQPIPPVWQIALAGVALISAFVMLLMRRLAADRWRRK